MVRYTRLAERLGCSISSNAMSVTHGFDGRLWSGATHGSGGALSLRSALIPALAGCRSRRKEAAARISRSIVP